MQGENNNTAGRELKVSRLYDTPVALVWEAWSNPEHISKWWGPDGFTATINEMEMTPGGMWELILHGPDGTDYYNRSIFRDIEKHKRIVFDHVSGPKFTATIEFEAQGGKTMIHWRTLFESNEQLIQVIKTFKADEGLKQNVEKLGKYLGENRCKNEYYKSNSCILRIPSDIQNFIRIFLLKYI